MGKDLEERTILLPRGMTKEDLEFLNLPNSKAKEVWDREKNWNRQYRLINMHTSKKYFLLCIEALNKEMWLFDPYYGELGYFSPYQVFDNNYRSTHDITMVDPEKAVTYFKSEIPGAKARYEATIAYANHIEDKVAKWKKGLKRRKRVSME